MFRCDKKLTQEEMAKKCEVSRATYALIEKGKRGGNLKFWDSLQDAFKLTDEHTRQLQKCEVEQCGENAK